MSDMCPDLNNEKILFREATSCLRERKLISAETYAYVVNATKEVKEAKGVLKFSLEELKGFELLMKARLRELYREKENPTTYKFTLSKKLEIELLNRAIDVLLKSAN